MPVLVRVGYHGCVTYLADLDISVLRAMGSGSLPDELLQRVGCAPSELNQTLAALRRLGLADFIQERYWQPTRAGRRLV